MSTTDDFLSLMESGNTGVDEIAKQLEANSSKRRNYQDDRQWKPETDKAKNGYATVRFLPTIPPDRNPNALYFVEVKKHAFQGDGWFIAECPGTIGQECVICNENRKYWDKANAGDEAAKAIAMKRMAGTKFMYNVLIIEDPKKPENNGKLKLWAVPKSIHVKILAAVNPPNTPGKPRKTAKDVFNFWKGYNFYVSIKAKAGWANYDDSEFEESPSPVFGGDKAKIRELYDSQYDLSEFHKPEVFQPAEDLLKRYFKVTGEGGVDAQFGTTQKTTQKPAEESNEEPAETPLTSGLEADAPVATEKVVTPPVTTPAAPTTGGPQSTLAKLKAKLAAEKAAAAV